MRRRKEASNIASVEMFLLHTDVKEFGMGFDTVLGVLREEGMYLDCMHVYAVGLENYVSPLEIAFEKIFDAINGEDYSDCGDGSSGKDETNNNDSNNRSLEVEVDRRENPNIPTPHHPPSQPLIRQ